MSLRVTMPNRLLLRLLMLCTGAIASAGCGQADPRLTIQGTVSLDGQPLPDGQVIFRPDNPALRAEGAAVKDGNFTIRVLKGSHRVAINAQIAERRNPDPGAPPGASPEFDSRSIIPARYNDKSTLSFTVESSRDRPRFDLTSDTPR